MRLTGEIATAQKQMTAQVILNVFLAEGLEHIREEDIAAVLEDVHRAQQSFSRYGIDVKKFLETGEV